MENGELKKQKAEGRKQKAEGSMENLQMYQTLLAWGRMLVVAFFSFDLF
jgi:hypothetical protein